MPDLDLRKRSIRTLAWLGDGEFEREVRLRVARRGDFPTQRLDTVRASIVRAEGQADLLKIVWSRLDEAERSLARRGRNVAPRSHARGRRNTAAYRSATALEALVAYWCLDGTQGTDRFRAVMGEAIERAIDKALPISRPPVRG
ncbi:MAG: ribonuclease III domain-containing protein [Nannocystaceae bacterium]